ncbi:hypothetical protein VTO73DRAFT_8508 [Trametes versicolor]
MRPIARSVHFLGYDLFAACNVKCGGFDPEHLKRVVFSLKDLASLQLASMMLRVQGAGICDVHLDVSYGFPHQGTSLWSTLEIAACVNLESLCFDWHHMGIIPGTQEQDFHACKRIAIILATTPRTLLRLTFSLPFMQQPDSLDNALRCLSPLIGQAVKKFHGLKTVTVRVTRSFEAEECINITRSTLPTRLLDSGVLQIEDMHC